MVSPRQQAQLRSTIQNESVPDRHSLKIEIYNLGPLENNTFLLIDEATNQAAIVDPTFDSQGIWEDIRSQGLNLVWVLNTHAHIDHVYENAYFVEKSGARLALHPDDFPLLNALQRQADWMGMPAPTPSLPTYRFTDGETIDIGNETIQIIQTPGHSPGSVSLLGDGWVISGDALFAGSIGRTDLPGGDTDTLLNAIKSRLLVLPDTTIVYPGHGPSTSIGIEKDSNPYIRGLF